jgi:hypothetical protein
VSEEGGREGGLRGGSLRITGRRRSRAAVVSAVCLSGPWYGVRALLECARGAALTPCCKRNAAAENEWVSEREEGGGGERLMIISTNLWQRWAAAWQFQKKDAEGGQKTDWDCVINCSKRE